MHPLSLQTLYSYCHTPARSFGGYPWTPEATMPHTKSHSPWVFTYPPGEGGGKVNDWPLAGKLLQYLDTTLPELLAGSGR